MDPQKVFSSTEMNFQRLWGCPPMGHSPGRDILASAMFLHIDLMHFSNVEIESKSTIIF